MRCERDTVAVTCELWIVKSSCEPAEDKDDIVVSLVSKKKKEKKAETAN